MYFFLEKLILLFIRIWIEVLVEFVYIIYIYWNYLFCGNRCRYTLKILWVVILKLLCFVFLRYYGEGIFGGRKMIVRKLKLYD